MTLSGDTPTVLLPVETASRELDSKLVVASFLASHGCRAIVGHKEVIKAIASSSRRVAWQGKDAFSLTSADHVADHLLARESAVMFIQEEGGIFPANEWEQSVLTKHRADFIRERRLSRLCAWGERQKDLFVQHGVALGDDIAITGCPRFDLCLPAYHWLKNAAIAQALVNRRPYILMCTRFTSVAHSEGVDRLFRLADKSAAKEIRDSRYATWQRDVHDFADFVVLVKEVATVYSEFDVVLRPHPSESIAFYRHAFAPFKNVTVSADGSVLDWIPSAKLVVHCNCTTGVEALLAGRPVLNMQPTAVPRDDCDKEVAKEAGVTATSIRDAVEKVAAMLGAQHRPHVWSSRAQSMLNNLKADAIPILVDETLKVLREKQISSSHVVLPPERRLRTLVKRWVKPPSANAYVASKRGTLDADHIEMVIHGCQSHHGGGSRVRHLTPEYVVIDPS